MRYKTCVILLEFALNILPYVNDVWSARQIAGSWKGHPYSEGRIRCFEAFMTMDMSNIYEACNICINAATLSASAYHMILGNLNPIYSEDIALA